MGPGHIEAGSDTPVVIALPSLHPLVQQAYANASPKTQQAFRPFAATNATIPLLWLDPVGENSFGEPPREGMLIPFLRSESDPEPLSSIRPHRAMGSGFMTARRHTVTTTWTGTPEDEPVTLVGAGVALGPHGSAAQEGVHPDMRLVRHRRLLERPGLPRPRR